jgi:hypothetical protein
VSRVSSQPRWLMSAAFIALYLLLACFWMGISFSDDSAYLSRATWIHAHSLVYDQDWAPLYSFWLKFLHLLFADPVHWYMGSWAILVVALSIVPLLIGNRLAWAYTLLLFLLPLFEIDTYVAHFAALILVCGAALVLRYKLSTSSATVLACITCFVAAYSRPEFAYGVYLTAAAALLALALDNSRGRPSIAAAKVCSVAAIVWVMHYSLAHTHSTRSGMAFWQHFNLRAEEKGILPPGAAWNSDYTFRLFHIPVGSPSSLPAVPIDAFYKADPHLFLVHILENVRDIHAIFPFCLLLAVAVWGWCQPKDRALRPAILYLLLICAPIIATVLLVYPRPHYFVIATPTLLLTALYLLPEDIEDRAPRPLAILLIGSALIMLKVAYRYTQPPITHNSSYRQSTALVRCIHAVELSTGHGDGTLFDTKTYFWDDIYFRGPRQRLSPTTFPDWTSYRTAILQSHPAWIIQNDDDATYNQQPGTMDHFLTTELTYTPHPCPASDGVVIYTHAPRP